MEERCRSGLMRQPAEWEKVGVAATVAPSSFLTRLFWELTFVLKINSSFFRSFSIDVHLTDIVFNILSFLLVKCYKRYNLLTLNLFKRFNFINLYSIMNSSSQTSVFRHNLTGKLSKTKKSNNSAPVRCRSFLTLDLDSSVLAGWK